MTWPCLFVVCIWVSDDGYVGVGCLICGDKVRSLARLSARNAVPDAELAWFLGSDGVGRCDG
eukprot:1885218-Rhodomonas_salina.2